MWTCTVQPGTGPEGRSVLSVLGKRTYRLLPEGGTEVDEDSPIELHLERKLSGLEDPDRDPVVRESDLVAWKPLIDVVVHGPACSPSGKIARFFDAGISISGRSRMVRVFGDRKIDLSSGRIRFSDPIPFETMPLHWGLAYGGTAPSAPGGLRLVYPRNPVGRGFLVATPLELLHGLALPNLENPAQPLQPDAVVLKRYDLWKRMPVPLALGWTSPHFSDRVVEGPVPASGRIPLPPPTPNAAPSFLRLASLSAGETITLVHMDASNPAWEFTVPDDAPRAFLDLGQGAMALETTLQTVEIHPATRQFTMLWRGMHPISPEDFQEVSRMEGWMESGPAKTIEREERKPPKRAPPPEATAPSV
ncbi:MAG: DUF2169 domain-containing protein [Fibrobacteria bacterium]|nr:DUF2169 domain-containing protein [Fibrobacteria bacterium]